jgi:hypothetical protein
VSRSDTRVARALDAGAFETAIIRPKIVVVESADSAKDALEAAPSITIGEVWRDMILKVL